MRICLGSFFQVLFYWILSILGLISSLPESKLVNLETKEIILSQPYVAVIGWVIVVILFLLSIFMKLLIVRKIESKEEMVK